MGKPTVTKHRKSKNGRYKKGPLVMDISRIPTEEGIDLEKWLYLLKTTGVAFVNSKEENK